MTQVLSVRCSTRGGFLSDGVRSILIIVAAASLDDIFNNESFTSPVAALDLLMEFNIGAAGEKLARACGECSRCFLLFCD